MPTRVHAYVQVQLSMLQFKHGRTRLRVNQVNTASPSGHPTSVSSVTTVRVQTFGTCGALAKPIICYAVGVVVSGASPEQMYRLAEKLLAAAQPMYMQLLLPISQHKAGADAECCNMWIAAPIVGAQASCACSTLICACSPVVCAAVCPSVPSCHSAHCLQGRTLVASNAALQVPEAPCSQRYMLQTLPAAAVSITLC